MKKTELGGRNKALSSSVRKVNRNLIFRHLYYHPGLSKQELSEALNLSLPTLTQNLSELLERGLICNDETKKQSTGGRKARTLNVRGDAGFAVGLDVTAHHLSGAVINLLGEIVSSSRVRIPFAAEDAYFSFMARFIEDMLDAANVNRSRVLGVGLAVPAIVSRDGQQLTYASILNFTHGRLSDFAQHIPYPCRFVNDADAGGFAEYWNNGALHENARDRGILYLMVSNSVGGAFFLDGEGYPGQNCRANEFGHITLHPEGRRCYCGQPGCADAYLNTKLLSDPYDGNLHAFFEALDAGDAQAAALWAVYERDLALLINSLRMAYDCDIVLGGYLGNFMSERRLRELRDLLAARNHFDSSGDYLIACMYRREAAAVGAGLSYVNDLLQSV